ncbi:PHP domain-containing protein [Paenibacillus thalictri]|uniref:PHP domain-containing protein n=1 Tax=Paenibacillus thalictri TaxID=2527873 RepID=A0A4Q9DIM4_9BACL|nr:PHP domain-containing protein [Paenibacillus thalictri]TBL70530.1 PHP domain-containing protein [Paenibacillus thalictri]
MARDIVDLHCHTHYSDNPLTVEEVLLQAKEQGVRYLAITDHDTTAGLIEAAVLGRKYGIEIIPGIEISAYDMRRKRRAHILGYYVEPLHPALEALCRPVLERRHEASRTIVQRLQQAGYSIRWEDALQYGTAGGYVYKQHIMRVLMDRGHCDDLHGELQRTLFHRGEPGKAPGLAYLPIAYADAVQAIAAIREAGGVAVLAHPGQLRNFEAIGEWVDAGLQGIEAQHPSHTPEDTALAREYAAKHNLIVTAGSDFHGPYGYPGFRPGCYDAGTDALAALRTAAEAATRSQISK